MSWRYFLRKTISQNTIRKQNSKNLDILKKILINLKFENKNDFIILMILKIIKFSKKNNSKRI